MTYTTEIFGIFFLFLQNVHNNIMHHHVRRKVTTQFCSKFKEAEATFEKRCENSDNQSQST